MQELLALLVEERRLPRVRAAVALWPDLDEEKALANLRVTLTYLQRVLEPGRDRSDPPFYVRGDGASIVLAEEVVVDADRFETDLTRARDCDRGGAPRVALQLYQDALGLYRGDYLAHVDAEWATMSRARLRFLAVNGLCRIGELLLARGEPEEAGPWALHARRLVPLNERAGRLHLACQLGAGDRAGAAADLRAPWSPRSPRRASVRSQRPFRSAAACSPEHDLAGIDQMISARSPKTPAT